MQARTWTCTLLALATTWLGCSAEPRTIAIDVVTGHETTAFRDDPAVARVDVTAVGIDGSTVASASAAPGGTLDLGDVPVDRPLTFEVHGFDATGATVARGRSLAGIYLAALDADALPVFAQRLGQWARPPGELAGTHLGAPGGALAERFVVVTGGTSTDGAPLDRADVYDLLAYGGGVTASLERAARSLVGRGEAMLLIADDGAAWVDFDAGIITEAALPGGLTSFAEVAGGRTVDATEGRSFVVGATRAGAATDAVLAIAADGSLATLRLSAARAGAAAVWVDKLGLVVAGGSAAGAGVEVLGDGAAGFSARAFPADPVEGAGAVATGLGEVALLGGVLAGAPAPTRRIAPTCSADCAAAELAGASLPVALADVAAFALPNGRAIVVGSEAGGAGGAGGQGATRSFVVDLAAAQVEELPLKEPRKGATAVPAPNGTLALLGGVHLDGTPALAIETYFPE